MRCSPVTKPQRHRIQQNRPVCFSRDVTALLREALILKKEKPTLNSVVFDQRAADLETRLDALIDENRRMTDPDNLRLTMRLRKHRPHLLRLIYTEGWMLPTIKPNANFDPLLSPAKLRDAIELM